MRDAIDALQILGAAIIVAYAAIKAARGGININVKHEHTPPQRRPARRPGPDHDNRTGPDHHHKHGHKQ